MPPGTPPQASWEVKGVEVDGEEVLGPWAPGEDEEALALAPLGPF